MNSHGDQFCYGGTESPHAVTITLAAPAETGGHDVDLVSNSSDLFVTSGTVTVPEGFTTWSFQVAETPLVVPTPVTATVTATDADNSMQSNDLTIRAMEPRFLDGNPTGSLEQGATYQFNVKLSAKVAANQTISVSSSNPEVSVTDAVVLAGNSHGAFFATVSDAATGSVDLTISFNGIAYTRTLELKKVYLSGLSAAGPVTAGTNASVTITLSRPVFGDRTINLTYDGPVGAGAPTSVLVTNGTASVTFNVPTASTLANGGRVLTITASYGGASKVTHVQVNP